MIHDWNTEEARERTEAVRERLREKLDTAFPQSFTELMTAYCDALERIDSLRSAIDTALCLFQLEGEHRVPDWHKAAVEMATRLDKELTN